MGQQTDFHAMLHKARGIVDSDEALAERLQCSETDVIAWLSMEQLIPTDIFTKAAELILDEQKQRATDLSKAISQLQKSPP